MKFNSNLFILIKNNNIKIAVASNSIKETITLCLSKLGIIDFVDCILSNEDVKYPKPHPEIYWKTMSYFGCLPEETVIFEDSFVGIDFITDAVSGIVNTIVDTVIDAVV